MSSVITFLELVKILRVDVVDERDAVREFGVAHNYIFLIYLRDRQTTWGV